MSFPIFIISWKGMHENALLISKDVMKITKNVTIVYSDPDPDLMLDASCQLIRRPNELFWEDKFKACLDACGEGPFLVIHADCRCDDWALLVSRCIDANSRFKNIGVWAPKIDSTYWNLSVSGIFKIKDTSLVVSCSTDGIVFYLSPEIIKRMRQLKFGNNLFGWGIDSLFCTASHVMDKLVVIDESVSVFHPQNTGYDEDAARTLGKSFLKQFSRRERLEFELLRTYVKFKHMKVDARRKNAN